ncbi:MAG TPA: hypothetical protein VFS59_19530 [Gemmatimonadaceae bacterium]|nr:hypothetical protein [Gemmatimonadaceae bacterium]
MCSLLRCVSGPPFGALAGRMPSIEIEDIKAARREALLGTLP